MECVPPKIDLLHLLLRDLDPRRIRTPIEFIYDLQTRLGRRRRDEVDDRFVTDQRLAQRVLADEREEPMLDLVPLAGARREVAHRDLQARVVDPVGRIAAEVRSDEVIDPHRSGLTLRSPLAPGILEVPDQLLLLGIDGDDRLAGPQGGLDLGGGAVTLYAIPSVVTAYD